MLILVQARKERCWDSRLHVSKVDSHWERSSALVALHSYLLDDDDDSKRKLDCS